MPKQKTHTQTIPGRHDYIRIFLILQSPFVILVSPILLLLITIIISDHCFGSRAKLQRHLVLTLESGGCRLHIFHYIPMFTYPKLE